MKNGCGKPVTKGHGEVAVCGKDCYGEIYTCDSCLKLRVAELEAVLRECRDSLNDIAIHIIGTEYETPLLQVSEAIAKIDEVLR